MTEPPFCRQPRCGIRARHNPAYVPPLFLIYNTMTQDNKHKSPKPVATDYPGDWTTALADVTDRPDTGAFVTVRRDIEKFRTNPRFVYAMEVSMTYQPRKDGLPDDKDAEMLGSVTDALVDVFKRDPVAVITAITTGDGTREWLFYTLSLNIFQRKFNEALADLPALPLSFQAVNDPDWEWYDEIAALAD